MRNLVLALLLAVVALCAGHARAMDGFDLGDMPPLPPPLLDNDAGAAASSAPLAPPQTGALSPLVQGQAGLSPVAPPPVGGATAASAGDYLAPPPPPLAPPPVAPATAAGGAAAGMPDQIGAPPPGDGAVAAAPVVLNETPQPGRITGGRVNVRAGPNTQYESVAVLTSGAPVTVMARHEDWYKIVFPPDQLASIHKSLVTAEITGEIPETGLPGIVSVDNAEVHAFYWDRSTVVGTLPQGTPVVIRQERGQWYRIDAPDTARAFVSAQYVRLEGAGQVVADAAPPPANPAVDLSGGTDARTGQVKLSENDRRVAELKEQYFKRIRDQYEAELDAEERAYQAAVEANKRQAEQLDLALKDLDGRLAAIDQETSQRMTYMNQLYAPTVLTTVGSATWAPPDPATGGYTGWVENIGRVGGAPSAHRLTKGGEIRFYLRSGVYNLDEFNNRRVWVNGPVEPASGASAAVLNVDQMRILSELEIAEGMRSSQGYQDAGAAQPYGAPVYDGTYAYDGSYAGTASDAYAAAPGTAAAPGGQYGYGAALQPGEVLLDPYTGLPVGGSADPYAAGAVDVGGVYAGSATGQEAFGGVPAQGITVSDPSQLPDVVSSGTGMYSATDATSFGMGGAVGASSMGEVETDYYERPAISEIAPE